MQAGAREQPEKLPAQHLQKPGREADLQLKLRFEAPDYRGSGKLEGLAAIVTGADSSIGRAVAVLFAREGPTWPSLTTRRMKMRRKQGVTSRPKAGGVSCWPAT